jgi:hypothetical protein
MFNAQQNPELQTMDDVEDLIKDEISREGLLSENEKKTIEVLVLDYLRNDKSVLDLIRLDKLEEDLKSQRRFDDEEEKHTNLGSEDREGNEMLWKMPDIQQYMELLTQKLPNKYERINEIKYKIPMKWTKRFNIDDIVPHKEKLKSAIASEGGMVNNYLRMKKKLNAKRKKKIPDRLSETVQPPTSHLHDKEIHEISTPQDTNFRRVSESRDVTIQERNAMLSEEDVKSSGRFNETDGFNQIRKKPIFTGQVGKANVPLSNTMLKESLSSKQDSPRNQTSYGQDFPKPGQTEETKTLLQKQKQHTVNTEDRINFDKLKEKDTGSPDAMGDRILHEMHIQEQQYEQDQFEPEDNANLTDHDIVIERTKGMGFEYDPNQLESPRTEAQFEDRSRDLASRGAALDYAQIRPLYKPPKYNIDEIEHLFVDGKIPEEIYNIEDPMEYNYLLVKLKKEFNDKTRSEFLKYMNLQLPYNSRRDEVGGVITDDDWSDFILRVEKMIRRVRRRRRRIIRRRKKKGKKLMPRKTLFKPTKRPDLAKDPLWREVFLDESSEDSTVEGTDIFEEEKFKVPEKPKKRFFDRKEKFELPSLYQPLVNGKFVYQFYLNLS